MSYQCYKALKKALENHPQEFSIGDHTLKDNKTKCSYWIANGGFFFGLYTPIGKTFSFPFNLIAYGMVKKYVNKKMSELISGEVN